MQTLITNPNPLVAAKPLFRILNQFSRVSRSAFALLVLAAVALVGSGCSEDAVAPPNPVLNPELHSVNILETSLTLDPGASAELTAVIEADEDFECSWYLADARGDTWVITQFAMIDCDEHGL